MRIKWKWWQEAELNRRHKDFQFLRRLFTTFHSNSLLLNRYAWFPLYPRPKMHSEKEHVMTVQDKKSGTEVAQSGTEKIRRAGKSHVDYWMPRLKKRAYEWQGKTVEIPEWE